MRKTTQYEMKANELGFILERGTRNATLIFPVE